MTKTGNTLLALTCRLLSLADGLQHSAPPQHHLAAEGALNLALRLGIAPHVVMDRLLGPSKAVSLYEAYKPVIHTWLIFNAGACAGKLFEALAGAHSPPQHAQRAQRTAGLILTGCLESLQRSRDAQAGRADIRQRYALEEDECFLCGSAALVEYCYCSYEIGAAWQGQNNVTFHVTSCTVHSALQRPGILVFECSCLSLPAPLRILKSVMGSCCCVLAALQLIHSRI